MEKLFHLDMASQEADAAAESKRMEKKKITGRRICTDEMCCHLISLGDCLVVVADQLIHEIEFCMLFNPTI
jgi:hypothetical protein